MVDSMDLLLAVLVTAADVDNARGASKLFARLDGQLLGEGVWRYVACRFVRSEV
jgi:putative transposase